MLGMGNLVPQHPACKVVTGWLCPSPEVTVPIGPPASRFVSALTFAPHSLRKVMVPCCFWPQGTVLPLWFHCPRTTPLHIVSLLNPPQITHLEWAICFLSEPNQCSKHYCIKMHKAIPIRIVERDLKANFLEIFLTNHYPFKQLNQ